MTFNFLMILEKTKESKNLACTFLFFFSRDIYYILLGKKLKFLPIFYGIAGLEPATIKVKSPMPYQLSYTSKEFLL